MRGHGILAAGAEARPLVLIAPTLFEAWKAARAIGLDPKTMEGVRTVTRAHALRGIRPGTPCVTWNRDTWAATREGVDLDQAVWALMRTGRLRIAGDDDIARARGLQAGKNGHENDA